MQHFLGIFHRWGAWEYLYPKLGHSNVFQVKRCKVCKKYKQTLVV